MMLSTQEWIMSPCWEVYGTGTEDGHHSETNSSEQHLKSGIDVCATYVILVELVISHLFRM
jgi:hypothetical protein